MTSSQVSSVVGFADANTSFSNEKEKEVFTSNSEKNAHGIDESLYSRQLYVLGADGMSKMLQSDVLIIGLNGLGVEIGNSLFGIYFIS